MRIRVMVRVRVRVFRNQQLGSFAGFRGPANAKRFIRSSFQLIDPEVHNRFGGNLIDFEDLFRQGFVSAGAVDA